MRPRIVAKGCTATASPKMKYPSPSLAWSAAERRVGFNTAELAVYRCRNCGWYHLTRAPVRAA